MAGARRGAAGDGERAAREVDGAPSFRGAAARGQGTEAGIIPRPPEEGVGESRQVVERSDSAEAEDAEERALRRGEAAFGRAELRGICFGKREEIGTVRGVCRRGRGSSSGDDGGACSSDGRKGCCGIRPEGKDGEWREAEVGGGDRKADGVGPADAIPAGDQGCRGRAGRRRGGQRGREGRDCLHGIPGPEEEVRGIACVLSGLRRLLLRHQGERSCGARDLQPRRAATGRSGNAAHLRVASKGGGRA